jgi:hypothetical protein
VELARNAADERISINAEEFLESSGDYWYFVGIVIYGAFGS